jgi:hypothetical protein
MTEDVAALSNLLASKFIARPGIRARQLANGEWRPERDNKFDRASLAAHLTKQVTYGHYMMNTDDKVKLFALDLDLKTTGRLPARTGITGQWSNYQAENPREHWMSRAKGPARDMLKYQMKLLAHELARVVQKELDIPVAVAYSGSKGLHVYGFTGLISGQLAREGALAVLDATDRWEIVRGKNFFGTKERNADLSPDQTFEQFEVEVYPKQETLADKDLGNLMRLPLGVNLKSPKDPTFFVDMRTPMTDLSPRNAIESLTTDDPWR